MGGELGGKVAARGTPRCGYGVQKVVQGGMHAWGGEPWEGGGLGMVCYP